MSRLRALPERYGRVTLILLLAILALGFGLRAYRVVEPLATPGDDAHAYYALSKALYTEGSYGGPEFDDASDWSPGAPLLYAAAFYATGGAREGTARIVELLLGMAAIVVVFLLGTADRLRRRRDWSPPSRSPSTRPSSTPPAPSTASRWRSSPCRPRSSPSSGPAERERLRAWLLPGLLFGVTAMARPEYLLVGAAFVVLAAIRVGRARGLAAGPRRRGAACSSGWRSRSCPGRSATSSSSTAPCRSRPAAARPSTSAPTCRPTANTSGSRRCWSSATSTAASTPDSEALEAVDPTPLFNRVADRYPDLPRDQALGKIGKEDFSKYFGEDPVGYLAMTARKVGRMWSSGVGEAMSIDRRPGRPGADRGPRAWPASRCSPGGAGGGSWSRWRRRSCSSPPSAPPRWRPRGATRC